MEITPFSERYGYVNPKEVFVREQLTESLQNSILNWISVVRETNDEYGYDFSFYEVDRYVWACVLNRTLSSYNLSRACAINIYITDVGVPWYKKLDLIEIIHALCHNMFSSYDLCIEFLNSEFERHNFAYRLVDGHIVEITSENEIKAIEEALTTPIGGVKTHLQTALKLLSASQGEPDYRNSIKESISAVECLCRTITGENTLGKALDKIEEMGGAINTTLKVAFEKLYGYTNNHDTGIRHSLMDDSNSPTSTEATYMLITCSAFINYLNIKANK